MDYFHFELIFKHYFKKTTHLSISCQNPRNENCTFSSIWYPGNSREILSRFRIFNEDYSIPGVFLY